MLNPRILERITHSYLFTSEEMAFEFVQALQIHPVDLIVLDAPLTKDIEGLQTELKYKPYGKRHLALIKNADSMNAISQNKLLKTLEEPLGDTVIVLVAQRRDALLKTILSRCMEYDALDMTPKLSNDSEKLAKEFYKMKSEGALFFELKELLVELDKETALNFLDAFENLLREDLIKSFDSDRIGKQIKLTEETRKNIKQSYSLAYALKNFALNI